MNEIKTEWNDGVFPRTRGIGIECKIEEFNDLSDKIKQALKLLELVEENTDDISNYNSTKEFLQSLLDSSKK